jgi:hypothetical protein
VALAFRLCPGEFVAFFAVNGLLGFTGFLFHLARVGEALGALVVFTRGTSVAFSFIGLRPLIGFFLPVFIVPLILTGCRRWLALPARLRFAGAAAAAWSGRLTWLAYLSMTEPRPNPEGQGQVPRA